MSRPLRLELAGGLYHVTSRGDRREDIYRDDADRLAWLTILAQTCERYNWRIHAWCQMSNHYHLIVETVEGNLSAGMRQLNGVYTQDTNRRQRLSGHVFQGRYKAILVERDSNRRIAKLTLRGRSPAAAAIFRASSFEATKPITLPA